ncbi:MAG: molybdopterin oxidoreductase family protein [Verrucomicrobiia bacterium]
MADRLTTCTFCGVGCGLYLETDGNQVVGVYPSRSHPTNQGRICVRGWHVHEVASSPERLKAPLLKKDGRFQEVPWEEAIAFIAARIKAIRDKHGPDALAFLNSPRSSNEEAYLLQKLARAVVGTNNVDHGTGVYCNNSIQVLLEMIGVPSTTNSIRELASSEVIVVDGVDLARQMPTVAGVVIRAKLNGSKLVVIDPRRHRVAESADLFLQLKPGTEAMLYGAMAKVIVDRGFDEPAVHQAALPRVRRLSRNHPQLRSSGGGRVLRRLRGRYRSRGGGVCPSEVGSYSLLHRDRSARRRDHSSQRQPRAVNGADREGRRRDLRVDRA